MKPIVGLFLCLVSVSAASLGSRGDLVDANCFRSEERNVNPDYISAPGARDLGLEVRACYPRANKTRKFIVVLATGEILALDAAGNTQAAQLVAAAAKRRPTFPVNVTGTISDNTIRVDSISAVNAAAL